MDKELLQTLLPDNERMKGLLELKDAVEFNKECAYWFIICTDLAPLELPTRPQEMLDYDRLSDYEKKNATDKFWRQPKVFGYINQKQSVIERNRGMLEKLKEFKEYIPEGDTTTRDKFDRYIAMYGTEPVEYRESWQDK